jgi:enoyl-CoA hydratase
VAKGAFLLLAADYRIGVAGDFKIGLNEVAIGMPMHHFGIELAKFRMSPRYVHRSLLLAEMFSPKQALEAGFLDKLVNSDDFADEVQVLAQSMTNLDMSAHGKTKQHARRPILAKFQQCIEQDLRP